VGQFEKAACASPVGVILSVAVFQAKRRTSCLTGPARKPNCKCSILSTGTEFPNPYNIPIPSFVYPYR